MKTLRLLVLAALLAPSLALAQPGPVALCTPLFNSGTGAVSCVPVGQTSPNITTINPLPVGGVANAAAPTFVEARAGYMSFDLAGNLRTIATLVPAGTQAVSLAAGSVVSGAYLSGALASGSMVDLVALSAPVAPATATATKAALIGCQATSAGINPTTGQQAAADCDLNNNLLVSAGGAPNLAIAQVSIATSDTAAAAARPLRRSITVQQITGTQNVFCNQAAATAANGVILPAVVGASFTFNTTSAIRCIAMTGAQTVAVAETF